jgi:hypothetical protein
MNKPVCACIGVYDCAVREIRAFSRAELQAQNSAGQPFILYSRHSSTYQDGTNTYEKIQNHVRPCTSTSMYVQSIMMYFHLDSCHLLCRTYVRCRTCMTYDIVRATHDIVLYIVRAMSYVPYRGYRRTTSYVRHRTLHTMSYDYVRHRV